MLSGQHQRNFLCFLLAVSALIVPATVETLYAAPEGGNPVNINRADVEEFELLPGIGPALARRIVEFRERNGPFKSVDGLLKVRGIGEKSLEKLRDLVTVGGTKKRS